MKKLLLVFSLIILSVASASAQVHPDFGGKVLSSTLDQINTEPIPSPKGLAGIDTEPVIVTRGWAVERKELVEIYEVDGHLVVYLDGKELGVFKQLCEDCK